MEYKEEDFLQISGLQHFQFCRRQWALIHLEQQWAENLRTVEGALLHQRAHDASQRERRGELVITRDMRVFQQPLAFQAPAMWWNLKNPKPGSPFPGWRGNISPIPSNISGVLPERTMPTIYSFARRPCVWKRCSAVTSRKGHCITAKYAAGKKWSLPKSFARR